MEAVPLAQILASAAAAAPALAKDRGGIRLLAEIIGTNTSGNILYAGRYLVSTDLTVSGDLMLLPGAAIWVERGATLTLAGDFIAPRSTVFHGAGRIDMNRGRAVAASPEWWGAAPGDSGVDSLPALQACLAAHPSMQLGSADYYISGTWKIATPHRRICGAGNYRHGPNQGTRIIVNSGALDVIQVGPDSMPGGPNDFLQRVEIRSVELGRTVAPVPPAPGKEIQGPAGMRVQYVLNCHFENISAPEHSIGYAVSAAVRSFFRTCEAFRSMPGQKRTNDFFLGFLLNGYAETGLAGGNASIYLMDCLVSTGGSPPLERSVGVCLDGAFADSFLINLETSAVGVGIQAYGVAQHPSKSLRRTGNVDLHIVMPILDQCGQAGIELVNLSEYALVDLVDPYVAVAAGGEAAIRLRDCGGQTTITGGQLLGWTDAERGGNALGVAGATVDGLAVKGTKLLGFRQPVALDKCTDFELEVAINNLDQSASQAAVRLADCERGFVRPRIKGRVGVFPLGIELAGRGNSALSVDCTGISPACIQGAGANSLHVGGGSIRRSGNYGSILVSGLMDQTGS
jgi:hypothetical protein